MKMIRRSPEEHPIDTVICIGRSWKNATLEQSIRALCPKPKFQVVATEMDVSVAKGAARDDLESASSSITSLTKNVVNLGMDIYQANAPTNFIFSSSEFMRQVNVVEITRKEFRNVATPGVWVQQDIIQLFLETLQREYSEKLFCIPTDVCAWILEGSFERAYQRIRPQWATDINTNAPLVIPPDRHIIAVMNDADRKHWIALFVCGGENRLAWSIDSCNDNHGRKSSQFVVDTHKQLRTFLRQEGRMIVYRPMAQQTDTSSCGLFVMRHLLHWAKCGKPAGRKEITQETVDGWRIRWAHVWKRIGGDKAQNVNEDTLKQLLME